MADSLSDDTAALSDTNSDTNSETSVEPSNSEVDMSNDRFVYTLDFEEDFGTGKVEKAKKENAKEKKEVAVAVPDRDEWQRALQKAYERICQRVFDGRALQQR